MTDSATQADVPRWQRRLLPGELLEAPSGRRSAHDWGVDIALFLVAIGIGLGGLVASWSDHSAFLVVADVTLGGVACLSLWLRRRHPVPVAILAVGAGAVSALASAAAPIAVFSAAVRASSRALVAIAVLSLASILIFPTLYPSVGGYGSQVLFSLLVVVIALGWGLFTRARRELVSSLRERAQRLEAEQRLRAEQAREAERRRIAREMHDVLAHRLSLLSVHAGALEFRPDAPPEQVAEAAGVIRASAHAALQELRDVIGVLREDTEESTPQPPQPTLAEVPALIEESRAAGMRVNWRVDESELEAIPAAVGRTAYRVVQEGLTNARKHAPSAAVEVSISAGADSALVVEVVSRRPVGGAAKAAEGADGLPGAGTGLVGLAERVELAGGELQYGPNAGGDFVLRATLPRTP
jgi:signal transduction histidine kinase